MYVYLLYVVNDAHRLTGLGNASGGTVQVYGYVDIDKHLHICIHILCIYKSGNLLYVVNDAHRLTGLGNASGGTVQVNRDRDMHIIYYVCKSYIMYVCIDR